MSSRDLKRGQAGSILEGLTSAHDRRTRDVQPVLSIERHSLSPLSPTEPISPSEPLASASEVSAVSSPPPPDPIEPVSLRDPLGLIEAVDREALQAIVSDVGAARLSEEEGQDQVFLLALTSSLGLPESLARPLVPELRALSALHPEVDIALQRVLKSNPKGSK